MRRSFRMLLIPAGLLLLGGLRGASAAQASKPEATFRANAQHTGIYETTAPAHSRELKWRVATGGTVRSTPAVAGGTVFFGSGDGFLHALDARSGKERWRFETGGAVSSSPAVAEGLVFFTSRDRHLYAVEAASGKLRWRSWEMGEDLPFDWGWDYFLSSPVVAGGRVFVGSGDGHLYAADARTGREVWRFKTGGRVRSSPAVADGKVFVGSWDGSLYAVDSGTGRQVWKFDTEGASLDSAKFGYDRNSVQSSPAVFQGTVFVGARDGYLYAVDAESGRQKWRLSHEMAWVPSSPAVLGGLVLVGNSDGHFYQAVDRETGKEKWRTPTSSNVYSSGAVAEGTVFFSAQDGTLYALDAGTGGERWRFRMGGPSYSSPALADGTLYIGSDDGFLYALGTGAKPERATRKAVFFNEKATAKWFRGDAEVRDFFAAAGYQVLGTVELGSFLRDRAADRAPSVVVFASDVLPDSMALMALPDAVAPPEAITPPGGGAPLLRQYLEAGGKAVWMGALPLLYEYDPATGKRAPANRARTSGLLGLDFTKARRDEYGVRVTPDGARWGLRGSWVTTMAVDPGAVTTVLALDENGKAAAWVKSYGGPAGTGFVRLWGREEPCQDLVSVQAAAEHGLE